MEARPSAGSYLIPALLFLVGAALATAPAARIANCLSEPRAAIAAAGVTSVRIGEEGRYDIYYEYRFAYDLRQDVQFEFRETRSGRVVRSSVPAGRSSYSFGGVRWERIGFADLEPGTYDVTTGYKSGGEPRFVLFRGSLARILAPNIVMIVIGALLAAGAAALIVILALHRHAGRPPGMSGP